MQTSHLITKMISIYETGISCLIQGSAVENRIFSKYLKKTKLIIVEMIQYTPDWGSGHAKLPRQLLLLQWWRSSSSNQKNPLQLVAPEPTEPPLPRSTLEKWSSNSKSKSQWIRVIYRSNITSRTTVAREPGNVLQIKDKSTGRHTRKQSEWILQKPIQTNHHDYYPHFKWEIEWQTFKWQDSVTIWMRQNWYPRMDLFDSSILTFLYTRMSLLSPSAVPSKSQKFSWFLYHPSSRLKLQLILSLLFEVHLANIHSCVIPFINNSLVNCALILIIKYEITHQANSLKETHIQKLVRKVIFSTQLKNQWPI